MWSRKQARLVVREPPCYCLVLSWCLILACFCWVWHRLHFVHWLKTPGLMLRSAVWAALAVRPDVLNAKYHVITNATYSCHNRDPVPAKFKHVMNTETRTLLCCDHIALWKALDAKMLGNGARCSDKNVKILVVIYINVSVDKDRRKNVGE